MQVSGPIEGELVEHRLLGKSRQLHDCETGKECGNALDLLFNGGAFP